MELLPANETFRMDEDHATNLEGAETKLVADEDLACPANRATAMPQTELGCDDEDVALLLSRESLESLGCPRVLPQTVRRDLTVPVVVESPRPSDLAEKQIDRTAPTLGGVNDIGEELHRDCRDRWNGEPPFRTFGQSLEALRVRQGRRRIEVECSGDDLDLLRDRLRSPVLLGVNPGRVNFLVRELVGPAIVGDETSNQLGKPRGLVDTLGFFLRETRRVKGGSHDPHEMTTFFVPIGDRSRRSQCV